MNSTNPLDIDGLLAAWNRGDEQALNDVMPWVYQDLRIIARRHLRTQASTIHSGTLAHEAYLKLVRSRGIRCQNRAHFLALCSQMIRRILVDHVRKHKAAKRGGTQPAPLVEEILGSRSQGVEVDALDEALESLKQTDPRKARVVELRFFGGLSMLEIAEVLETSETTVTRDWRMAKAWLLGELSRAGE